MIIWEIKSILKDSKVILYINTCTAVTVRPWLNSRFLISDENRSVWNWMKAGLIRRSGIARTIQGHGVWANVQGVSWSMQIFDVIGTPHRGMVSNSVLIHQRCISRKIWVIDNIRVDWCSIICQYLRNCLQWHDKLLANRTTGLQRWLYIGSEAGQGWNRMIVHQRRLMGSLVVTEPVDWVVYIEWSFVWRCTTADKQQGWCEKECSGHPSNVKGLSELPPLGINKQRIVKIPNNHMTCPWHRDKDTDTSQKLHATCNHQKNGLRPFVTPETRNTLQSCQSNKESQTWQGHRAAHQASGCL